MRTLWFLSLLIGLACCHVSSQQQCSYLANVNITASDAAPPKFVVTPRDCCDLCGTTSGCVAAVYSNYYCHLKTSFSEQVSSQGSLAIITGSPTTISSAPTTSPPPPSTTEAPLPVVTVIRETTCQTSSVCNRLYDFTCVTNAFVSGVCRGDNIRTCNAAGTNVTVTSFQYSDCDGAPVNAVVEPVVSCEFLSGSYFALTCDVEQVPAANVSLNRTSCPNGCGQGSGCTTTSFFTGVCGATNKPEGYYTIPWCYPDFVVYNYFMTTDCSGAVVFSVSEPIGAGLCFESSDQQNEIENVCG